MSRWAEVLIFQRLRAFGAEIIVGSLGNAQALPSEAECYNVLACSKWAEPLFTLTFVHKVMIKNVCRCADIVPESSRS